MLIRRWTYSTDCLPQAAVAAAAVPWQIGATLRLKLKDTAGRLANGEGMAHSIDDHAFLKNLRKMYYSYVLVLSYFKYYSSAGWISHIGFYVTRRQRWGRGG